jgi:hypothetical protein
MIRNGHTVTVTASVNADELAVNLGGSLVVNNGVTFTIDNGSGTDLTDDGTVTTAGNLTNNGQTQINSTLQINQGGFPGGTGTYAYNSTGGLIYNNTSGVYGPIDSGHIYWPATNGPQHVNVQGAGGINLAVSRTLAGTFQTAAGVTLSAGATLTLNGNCQLNAGGFFNNSPTYGSASTLIYNTPGGYNVGNEWTGNSTTAGTGAPFNVKIQSGPGGTVSMPNANRSLAGTLEIFNGAFALNATSGDLSVGGNWIRNPFSSSFTANNRAVIFNGASDQTINVAGGIETFDYLITNKPAGSLIVFTGSVVVVNASVGQVLQLLNGNISVQSNSTLNLNSNGGNVLVSGGARSIDGPGTVNFNGTKTVTSASGGTLSFNTNGNSVNLAAGVDFGAGLSTVNGTLKINTGGFVNTNAPTYAAGSTLVYNSGGTYGRGAEWSATSGTGYPVNVQLSNNTTLDMGANGGAAVARQMAGNLTINAGSTFSLATTPMSAAVTVLGSVTNLGTLTLSTISGGDIKTQGSFNTFSGTFTPNGRAIFFEGGNTQDVLTSTPFDYVLINKTGGTVKAFTNVVAAAPGGGNALSFQTAQSTYTLNDKSFTIQSGTLASVAGSGFIGSAATSGTVNGGLACNGTGDVGTLRFASDPVIGDFVINRTGTGGNVTLGTSLTARGNTVISAGTITTGANTLTVGEQSAVFRTVGGVVGNMQRLFAAGSAQSFTFPMQTANGYAPVSMGGTTGSGSLTVTGVDGKQPNVSGTNALNRYWTLAGTGITTNLTFQYNAGDVVGAEANYQVVKHDAAGFTVPANQTVDANAHTATVNGVSSFSDWTLAEPASVFGALQFSAANYDDTETNSGTHNVTITVSRIGAASGAIAVHYATSDGTATTADNDYDAASGDLNWADGDATDKTFTVTVHGDAKFESNETVNLTLSAPTGGAVLGTPDTATLTIQNDDNAPTLAVGDVTQAEGSGSPTSFDFIVTKTGATDSNATVNFATVDGTATGGATCGGSVDYVANNGSLTFLPGEFTKTVSVQVCGDTDVEPDEAFTVHLSNASGATITDADGTGTIQNDDANHGSVSFSANNYPVNEGQGRVTITVTRTGGSDGAISVNYITNDDTATQPDDYTQSNGTLNWADGDAAPKSFDVPIVNDAMAEPVETFHLQLTSTTGGATIDGQTTTTVTITDNDAAPNVKVIRPGGLQGWTQEHTTCGAAGTGSQAFVVGPATPPVGEGSLQYLIGANGDSFETIRNPDLGDTRIDALSNLSYSTYVTQDGSGGQAAYLLLDIDFDGDTTVDDQLFFEPVYQHGHTAAVPDQGALATGAWQTWDALHGGWWSLNSIGGLTPGAGVNTLAAYLAAQPNARIVNSATGAGGFRIATGCGAGAWDNFDGNADNVLVGVGSANTLYDLEPLPRLSISDVTQTEGDAGQTDYVFNVTLSRASEQTVMVDYATADDTATTADGDYDQTSGTLTFDPGDTGKPVTVHVNGDTTFEPNEQFFVNLSNISATATISDAQGVGTIQNDDAAPVGTIQFAQAAYSAGEGAGAAHITFKRVGGSAGMVSASFSTSDGTAEAGSDYTSVSQTVTFADGDTTDKTVDVPIGEDLTYEGDETVNLSLGATSTGRPARVAIPPRGARDTTAAALSATATVPGATLGRPDSVSVTPDSPAVAPGSSAVLTILDNDPQPSVSVNDVFVAEPATGTTSATFTVTLSNPASTPVTLDYATADDTANAPDDYVAVPPTPLSIPAGSVTQTFTVTVNADAAPEPAETFFVNLSNLSANATFADNQGQGTITDPTQAGQLLISEFRTRGTTGAGDEFIELYNNTNAPVTVATSDGSAGWAVVSSDAPSTPKFVIPAGTVIPARGHFLGAQQPASGSHAPDGAGGSGSYSLGAYAVADATYTQDIPDGAGLAVFSTADASAFNLAHRLDAVGFASVASAVYREGAGLQPATGITSDAEFSFVRNPATGTPQDTDDNAQDFVLVAADPALVSGATAQLGAPGPEDCGCNPENAFANASPVQRNATIKTALVEPQQASTAAPNRVRDLTENVCNGGVAPSNCTFGTLSIRRRFTNNTGQPVTRLRFRIVDVTTLNTPNPGGQQADVRLVNSGNFNLTTSRGPLVVYGTMVETPPGQPHGGGLNSSVVVGSLATPLAPNAFVDVQFLLGVQQNGRFRFLVNVEALP